jgi:1-acyl-sn-glycerol-3-phosphate acyltransferase
VNDTNSNLRRASGEVNRMPPVKNRLLYIHRVTMKALSFFVFGLGSVFLVFPIMPVSLLIFRPIENCQKKIRRLVSAFFRLFISMMYCMGIVEFSAPQREFFGNLHSKIVVSNHPSLLDIVMLISLIPNADVIVQGYLSKTIVGGIVKRLYILNSLNFEEQTAACKESLAKGNCLVIFPEGTRTRRNEKMRLKKGAVRISFLTGAEIVTAYIGGTDKYGLGKKDPFFSFNHTEKYIYRISLQKIINPEQYAGMEIQRAVRRMNAQILEVFQNPVNP